MINSIKQNISDVCYLDKFLVKRGYTNRELFKNSSSINVFIRESGKSDEENP